MSFAFIIFVGLNEFFIILFFKLIIMIPFWFILKKLKYNPFLSLLLLIPLVDLIFIYYIAFSNSNNDREQNYC